MCLRQFELISLPPSASNGNFFSGYLLVFCRGFEAQNMFSGDERGEKKPFRLLYNRRPISMISEIIHQERKNCSPLGYVNLHISALLESKAKRLEELSRLRQDHENQKIPPQPTTKADDERREESETE
jgi:hypothetical protein